MIRYYRDGSYFPAKRKLLSCKIQVNTLFKNNDRRKIRKYDRKIHKAIITTVNIYQMNKKLFVTAQPKNACKLEFADNLWLPFPDKPQSEIVVFK